MTHKEKLAWYFAWSPTGEHVAGAWKLGLCRWLAQREGCPNPHIAGVWLRTEDVLAMKRKQGGLT